MKPSVSRRKFLSTVAKGTVAGSVAMKLSGVDSLLYAKTAAAGVKPNIVYIMADDMGYGDVSCYNTASEPKIVTQNCDRLAKEGIRFSDAHSPGAVCTPTRYALLTGRFCWRTEKKSGSLGAGDTALLKALSLIEPDRMTTASLMKKHGYATAIIGKWHLGLNTEYNGTDADGKAIIDYDNITHGPNQLGFDYSFILPGSNNMKRVLMENGKIVDQQREPLNEDDKPQLDWWREIDTKLDAKCTAWLKDHIKNKPDTPFYLHYVPSAPHDPWQVPEIAKGKSKAGSRGDMCWMFDYMVGNVLKILDSNNLTDNTLVIVTSDNGPQPGLNIAGPIYCPGSWWLAGHKSAGDLRGYKTHIWEGGHRVFFIARWPGYIPADAESDETISLVDMLATYAALMDEKLPDTAGEDSYNILPALLGMSKAQPIREYTVCHSQKNFYAVRKGAWKYIDTDGSGGLNADSTADKFCYKNTGINEGVVAATGCDVTGQLYDLKTDLSERKNLYCDKQDLVTELSGKLDTYQKQGYTRPIPFPAEWNSSILNNVQAQKISHRSGSPAATRVYRNAKTLHIDIGEKSPYTAALINAQGKTVRACRGHAPAKFTLDMRGIAPGLYYLKTITDKNIYTAKVVIQN
jgi:arylsulfatase A-like enzyme